jgi:hypothetical protein
MNHTTNPACAADDEGRRCTREPVMLRPVALCEPHRIEIALAVVPVLLRDQLAAAQESLTAPAPRSELVATAVAVDVDGLLGGVHDSVVYFLANGGRVKIGYTTNLKSRLGSLALRRGAALLALQGGPELERALHSHFAAYRDGSTEWFELSPEIFRYIAAPHPAATAVAEPVEPVAEPVAAEARPTDPAALRRAVRRLNRHAVKDTGRPVAISVLRAELGLSRREATALRRAVVEEGSQS